MKLFNRKWSLILGDPTLAAWKGPAGVDVSDLNFSFSVKKTLKVTPNTCDLVIYNLSNDSRKRLETPKKLTVKLEAGYEDAIGQIYLGEVRAAVSTTDGPETVTKISSGDGEKAMQTARINVSYGPKTPPDVALHSIATALGANPGNLAQAAALLQAKGFATLYSAGVVISGNAARELTDFCKSADLEWSIQDGALQILDLGKPMEGEAYLLSPTTGLVASPEVDAKGIVTCTTLMIPGLRPGQKVAFDANHLKGGYRVTQAEYLGENFGNDWYIHLVCRKY